MDTILVVSPAYMDAVKSCLSLYRNFCIAGYSKTTKAISSLPHLSGADLLGVAYLADAIKPDDVNNIRVLVNKVNILFQDRVDSAGNQLKVPFLFLLSTKSGGATATSEYLLSILSDIGTDNLDIGYYNFDMVTDTLIKVQMFGTILLKKRPLEIDNPEIIETFNNDSHLGIKLPFDMKYIEVYAPLTFVEKDSFLCKYPKERILCLLRTYLYNKSDVLLADILSQIDKMSFEEKMPYEMILRNLGLEER